MSVFVSYIGGNQPLLVTKGEIRFGFLPNVQNNNNNNEKVSLAESTSYQYLTGCKVRTA